MTNGQMTDTESVAAFLLDCTLATVERMATKKARGKNEYHRQIRIAQRAYDCLMANKADISGTRAAELPKSNHCVAEWAARIEVN